MLPGQTGSSSHSTLYGSTADANWISMAGGMAQWQSNMMVYSGPFSLRRFSIDFARPITSDGLPEKGCGPPVPSLVALGLGYMRTLSRSGPPSRR